MKISRFQEDDGAECLDNFLSNQGKYFDKSEYEMFSRFLKNRNLIEEFFTIVDEGRILGCGGFERTGPEQFDLTWGMIHRDFHRKSYGGALLKYRLNRIKESYGEVIVRVETSQHAQGFFEVHGFELLETKPDGFGKGIDYVLLTRKS